MLVAAHGMRVAIGPLGYRTGFPEVRKLFSAVPETDRSDGASILNFSHRIALPKSVRYVTPSPDGRTVLLLTKEAAIENQSILRLDTDTRVIAPAPLTSGGSARSIAFSPDGGHVAVNLEGRLRGEKDYHFGRIRLLATDGFRELADYWAAEQDCAFSREMTFSDDGRALWVLCEWSSARPQDLLAVKLALPDLEIVERRPRPAGAGARAFASMSTIAATASGVVAAGYVWDGVAEFLSVTDVTTSRTLLAPRNMWEAVPGGPGVGFCGLYVSRDATLVTLAHCAPALQLKYDPSLARGQFRTFDIGSGDLVANFAQQSPGRDPTQWSLAFDRAHGRLVGIGTTLASKIGTLAVWDQKTGRELQRIETVAYRSGVFSLDGRWLLLLGRDDEAIYFYRAEP
ncbi:MAG TPA: hypothetical protein VGH49_18825, partial [Xanthobacteraceae bacterium]